MEFSANRYRPEGKKFDRVYITATERMRGDMGVTAFLRPFGLIDDREVAYLYNSTPPTGPEDKHWKYEFEIKTPSMLSDSY